MKVVPISEERKIYEVMCPEYDSDNKCIKSLGSSKKLEYASFMSI